MFVGFGILELQNFLIIFNVWLNFGKIIWPFMQRPTYVSPRASNEKIFWIKFVGNNLTQMLRRGTHYPKKLRVLRRKAHSFNALCTFKDMVNTKQKRR
jgi:hypothetical protein